MYKACEIENHIQVVNEPECDNNAYNDRYKNTTADNTADKPNDLLSGNDINLTIEQNKQLVSLINKYQIIFQNKPGLHSFYSHKFNVVEHKPFKIRPYPIPISRRPAVQHEIDRMIK